MPHPILLCALALACSGAAAQVEVTAVRDPVSKSYRKMLEGMDLFEKQRDRAPGAELRFKLLPRKRDTRMDQIQLEVVGNSFTTPVAVDAGRTFTLARDERAIEEDAQVRPNRRAQTMTWRTEIRSPGLPRDTRRLGDLRLECEVGMQAELVSNRTAWQVFMDSVTGRNAGYCDRIDNNNYLFFADRPVFNVRLVSGERREVLPAWLLWAGASEEKDLEPLLPWCDCEVLVDRTFTLPLGDKSWPDSTRVEIEYMDEADDARGAAGIEPGDGKDEVRAALGAAKVLSFDSGYEVWVSRTLSPETKQVTGERVVLFDPKGVVRKSRAIRLVAPPKS